MREKAVEAILRMEAERAGGRALKFVSPGTAGVPDRIVILPGGRICFVELKAPGEKPRPLQRVWLHRLYAMGFPVATADNAKTARRLVWRI